MMRFKKGSKVEVLNKKELPSGSWRGAEIISGNGHNYSIRYDNSSSLTSEAIVERVSRKAIRPCPPLVQGLVESWMPGDIVEVFNDFYWKMATVLKVLCADYYSVRLLRSCQFFTVHKSDIRLRQLWEDDKWVVIGGKSCRSSKGVNFRELHADTLRQVVARNDCLALCHNAGFQDSNIVPSRTRKRRPPYCSSHHEVYDAKGQKVRAIEEKETFLQCVTAGQLGKVDAAVAYPRENLGEKYMHAYGTTEKSEIKRSKVNDLFGCSVAGSFVCNESDTASSVGSCSITSNGSNEFSPCFPLRPSRDTDASYSDAESSCFRGDVEEKSPLPSEKELEARTHRLQLHSYRCTLEGLYASGPLSWEQEELLTNLRLSLHISNDEHLMEDQRGMHCFQGSKDDATFLLV